jgi:hypothetical protein
MPPTEPSRCLPSPRSPTAHHVWSTEDELLFVTSLGAWCPRRHARAPLLRRYLAACAHRQEWGHIDMVQVQLRVERLLAEGDPEAA